MAATKKPASNGNGKLSIILSKGTLDMTYPAFILATTAAAMGREVHVFFTFWGLGVLEQGKGKKLRVASVGNPGLPMPNLLGALPGMTALTTSMMKGKMKKVKIATIPEMIQQAKDSGVHLHACSTTMDVMGVKPERLIPEVDDIVGAASFLKMSEGAQIIFI